MLRCEKLYPTLTHHILYNIEYALESEENYHAYQQKNAPELKDVTDRFSAKFSAVREFYHLLFDQ
jgi:hypothetical protein